MECPVDEAGLRFLFAYVADEAFRGLVDAEQPHEKLSKGALQAAVAILPRLSTAAYNVASPSGKPLDGNAVQVDAQGLSTGIRVRPRQKSILPRRYALFGTSGLSYEVQADMELISIQLTSK